MPTLATMPLPFVPPGKTSFPASLCPQVSSRAGKGVASLFVDAVRRWFGQTAVCDATFLRTSVAAAGHRQNHRPRKSAHTHTHTHTRLMALCPGLPRWADTRRIKPIWILLKQETVSGSSISWDICKSAPRSGHITTPAPRHSSVLKAGCPSCRPTNSVKTLKAKVCNDTELTELHHSVCVCKYCKTTKIFKKTHLMSLFKKPEWSKVYCKLTVAYHADIVIQIIVIQI